MSNCSIRHLLQREKVCVFYRRVSVFGLFLFADISVALVCHWSLGDRFTVVFVTSVWLSHGVCLLSAVQEHVIVH